ncbi:HpcH/HpaI aldolase/citrate lyase family protein [Altererythrobacter sp. C41]|uniref:HpcH/HpaI aldolase/citrate lyase family protein n=1 Tax=Altererythrobacter sp. C41 TaxID=2806021 RepID=UPI00193378D1|nr:CoA ester lyase [Altererythrobacter sp. C41]MBM0169154.1 CoA ester lyase [Altererythrobacter sp. C41]
MRSWLFAPGDSEKKMAKAADGPADIVLLDLEDSVAPERKPLAREMVRDFLAGRADRERLWVRINPRTSGDALHDLEAVMSSAPGGLLLPKAEGPEDVEALDTFLIRLEKAHGIPRGSTRVAALVTETPKAMFRTGDYEGAPRLVAMSWGAEDLSSALGARIQFRPDGGYMPTYELARSLCLLGAAAAGVAAIETIQADFRDLEGLRERAMMVRSQGYRGMLAIHPAQVDVINDAFTPGEDEIAHARAVIAAFAANPGAGTVGLDGAMLDRPHLALAQALLADAGADA